MLPLMEWEEKEAIAAAQHSQAQRSGGECLAGGVGSSMGGRAAGKQCSGASGERLQLGGSVDPALHSFVQRSWLPDRQHFNHYCADRADVWESNAARDRKRNEQDRITRRGSTVATTTEMRSSAPEKTLLASSELFDRKAHAFTTSPAFKPIQ